MQAAVVFPYYFRAQHDDVALSTLEKQIAACRQCNFHLIFVSDGPTSEPIDEFLTHSVSDASAEGIGSHLHVHRFEQHCGLTRSWNWGAGLAFNELDCDVCILSNFDAWPREAQDLKILAEQAEKYSNHFVACGPYSDNPGHCEKQKAEQSWNDYHSGVQPVAWVNGFSWAISRANYQTIVRSRNFFLCDDPRLQLRFHAHGGALLELPEDADAPSLAMLGQEDELFLWAHRNLNLGCGIAPCFWHHKKLQSYLP